MILLSLQFYDFQFIDPSSSFVRLYRAAATWSRRLPWSSGVVEVVLQRQSPWIGPCPLTESDCAGDALINALASKRGRWRRRPACRRCWPSGSTAASVSPPPPYRPARHLHDTCGAYDDDSTWIRSPFDRPSTSIRLLMKGHQGHSAR